MSVYRLKVQLDLKKPVWRVIDILGDQTLDNLHDTIQKAFKWDDDHLYAFYLNGKAWDRSSEYISPRSNGSPFDWFSGRKLRYTDVAKISSLKLRIGQEFLYIFDFGYEWRHYIQLVEICHDIPPDLDRYPKIMERHGAAPEQYPSWGEVEEVTAQEETEECLGELAPLAQKVKTAVELRDHEYSKEELEQYYNTAMEIYQAVKRDAATLDRFDGAVNYQLNDWLTELSFCLARKGWAREAATICLAWSKVLEAENFLDIRALIFAEAGLEVEAREQLKQNLDLFPEDFWIRIGAGDICYKLKDFTAAEEHYRLALKMEDNGDYDRHIVFRRLLTLLKKTGRDSEAKALKVEQRRREIEQAQWMTCRRKSPKMGRNELCLCGSGQKFKKCCLNKTTESV